MSDRAKRAIAQLAILFAGVIFIAVVIPMLVNAFAGNDSPATPLALPSDLCMIDGKPLMPELDYVGYGNPNGLVLKYVNTDGNLVLLINDKPMGVYEGDFCPSHK